MIKYLKSNTLVAQLVLLISAIGTLWGYYTYGATAGTILLPILGYFLYVGIGISVTFHRHLCHRSYKTHPWIVKLGTLLGTFSNTGSSLVWVAIHMNHHRFSDTDKDPHSPRHQGVKTFALEYDLDTSKVRWKMKHLIGDPFHMFLHKYYFGVIAAWSLFLYLVGGAYLMIFLHWFPMIISGVMSNIVNYVGHKKDWPGGYRRYDLRDDSVNNVIMAIPSWGETLHNNHHKRPYSWTHSERWWEIDIGGYIVKLIKTG
jgi:stearoyl-CoA desaturase (delta-9 desaturase)